MLDSSGGGGGASADGSRSGGGCGSVTVEEMVAAVENGAGEDERSRGDGNRWPRQETLALLKIRADMDLAFRDASIKGPLWEEVARKLGELGYLRSWKKCKEKFENIYKYHKRTKDSRSGSRQNGKRYRFTEQLEKFNSLQWPPTFQNQPQSPFGLDGAISAAPLSYKPTGGGINEGLVPHPNQNLPPRIEFLSPSPSSTSSSERESEGSSKRKKKLSEYFERLMRQVLEKQEALQMQLLQALEKCEKDRLEREEAWRSQMLDRIKKEQEYLDRERNISAARDATVMAFLRQISEQSKVQFKFPEPLTPVSDKHVDNQQPQTPLPLSTTVGNPVIKRLVIRQAVDPNKEIEKQGDGSSENTFNMSSSRWPKGEVEELIRLRTSLGMQFQDNGLKGPLWEEISSAMKKLGYDRNAKRCKEKWENINKYYKRVKDSNKRRPESSKTCPYFNLLESLYGNKSPKIDAPNQEWSGSNLKPEDILMQMMGQQEQQKQSLNLGGGSNVNQSKEEDAMEDEEDDESGGGYELVANPAPSVA